MIKITRGWRIVLASICLTFASVTMLFMGLFALDDRLRRDPESMGMM